MSETRVCLGAFAGPHGVRGLLKVKSFTEVPEDVAAYGPLSDESGARRFEIEVLGRAGGSVLVRVQGIGDRDAAAALRGTRLFVAREALPPTEAEDYYHADLIGQFRSRLDLCRAIRCLDSAQPLKFTRMWRQNQRAGDEGPPIDLCQ